MRSIAWASDDTSSDWYLQRVGGGRVICETVTASSVVRVDMSDAPPLAEGFGLLSDLIAELSSEIADERIAMAAEMRQEGKCNLSMLRMAKGLSQAQLAVLIGTSQPAVCRLEAGTQEPKLSTLRRIADVLDVDQNTLSRAFPDAY